LSGVADVHEPLLVRRERRLAKITGEGSARERWQLYLSLQFHVLELDVLLARENLSILLCKHDLVHLRLVQRLLAKDVRVLADDILFYLDRDRLDLLVGGHSRSNICCADAAWQILRKRRDFRGLVLTEHPYVRSERLCPWYFVGISLVEGWVFGHRPFYTGTISRVSLYTARF
jgi:hypothetical protein